MRYKLRENDKKVYVVVETDLRGDKDEVQKCRLENVLSFLQEQKVQVGTLVRDNILTNTNPDKVIAVWIFEKTKKKKLEKSVEKVYNDGSNEEGFQQQD